jgi:hypothetical protein
VEAAVEMGRKMGRKCKRGEMGVWKCGSGKGRRKWEGRGTIK